ncbi:rho guanine nucleotide exchange factor 17, partial [Caerostris darwini]
MHSEVVKNFHVFLTSIDSPSILFKAHCHDLLT